MKRSVSLVDLKGLNKNSVYNYIYREREASKQQIVQGLNMGLSTVSQNIRLASARPAGARPTLFESCVMRVWRLALVF